MLQQDDDDEHEQDHEHQDELVHQLELAFEIWALGPAHGEAHRVRCGPGRSRQINSRQVGEQSLKPAEFADWKDFAHRNPWLTLRRCLVSTDCYGPGLKHRRLRGTGEKLMLPRARGIRKQTAKHW